MASGTAMVAVSYGMVRYGYGLQLPTLSGEFGLTPGTAGAIAAGGFASYCLAALGAQRLIDRRGARVALWLAAVLAAGGALVVAVAWTAPLLALGVVAGGSAAGATSPALVVAVAASVEPRHADRAQALVNAGTGLGVAVVGAGVLAAPQVWRPSWVLAALGVLVAAALVDRRTCWPAPGPVDRSADVARGDRARRGELARPVVAALVAGLGSAAVWTFGRDLVTTSGDLPPRTTAALWVLLGSAAVLGGLSGDAVRVLGLRSAWSVTAALTAAGTALVGLAPGRVVVVAVAVALFGGAFTAMSGVLIAWAGRVRPEAPGNTTATLFLAFTAGHAVGAAATGLAVEVAGGVATFVGCGVLLLVAAAVRPQAASDQPSRSSAQASVKARRAHAW